MSSAIEMLDNFLEQWVHNQWNCWGIKLDPNERPNNFMSQVATQLIEDLKKNEKLKEALLALEKQEELKEWLEKEITSNEDKIKLNIAFAQSYSGVNNGIMCEKDFLDDIEKIKIENRILKEVLGKVGEQK